MDQLWAIKQNVDSFPASIFFVDYNPLAVFRFTLYRCPYSLFLVPIIVAGYLGSLLVIGGIYACGVHYWNRPTGFGDLIFFIAFVLPLLAWIIVRAVQVICSIRRYNGRWKTSR